MTFPQREQPNFGVTSPRPVPVQKNFDYTGRTVGETGFRAHRIVPKTVSGKRGRAWPTPKQRTVAIENELRRKYGYSRIEALHRQQGGDSPVRNVGVEQSDESRIFHVGEILPFKKDRRSGAMSPAVPMIARNAWEAFKLPGDILMGNQAVDPRTGEGMRKTLDLAGLLTGGGLVTRGRPNSITMGLTRLPPYKRVTSGIDDFTREIENVIKTGNSSTGRLFREDLGEITIDFGTPGNRKNKFRGGWGLSDIIDKRTAIDGINGIDFARKVLPKIFKEGKLVKFAGPNNARKAIIETPDERLVLGLLRKGQKESWVITGYEKWY